MNRPAPEPEADSTTDSHPACEQSETSRAVLVGTAFGFLAAFGYTAANMALRALGDLSTPGDLDWAAWVMHWKAMPCALVAWLIILRYRVQGRTVLPRGMLLLKLLGAALFMQFGGNLMFQTSLGIGGLVLTVPVTFATLISSGALLSRLLLGEPITARSIFAMTLLVVAIAVLSYGGDSRAASEPLTTREIALAVLTASIAGLGYGLSGVIIRQSLTSDTPISATLVSFSTTGVIALGLWVACRTGWGTMWERSDGALPNLLAAGVATCIAFFAVAAALERISVVRANLINATQIALCSIAGVLFFGEALNAWIGGGILLTIVGLLVMDDRSQAAETTDVEIGVEQLPAVATLPTTREPATERPA